MPRRLRRMATMTYADRDPNLRLHCVGRVPVEALNSGSSLFRVGIPEALPTWPTEPLRIPPDSVCSDAAAPAAGCHPARRGSARRHQRRGASALPDAATSSAPFSSHPTGGALLTAYTAVKLAPALPHAGTGATFTASNDARVAPPPPEAALG